MNMKSITVLAACLVSIGFFAAPVRADDAASNAVKQCFLNMQSVHSYRTKTVVLSPGYEQSDLDTVSENTRQPLRNHLIITNSTEKYKYESVTADKVMYSRTNDGSWQAQPAPYFDAASWGTNWSKHYDSNATYLYVRKDTINSILVDVYATSGIVHDQQTYTEIWIGVKDRLPHEILTHSVQADKIEHYTTQTFSDFNASIKIDVPDVAPSDSSTPETTSDSSRS